MGSNDGRRAGPGIPEGLRDRLALLRRIAVTERDVDARARLLRERPARSASSFEVLVAARLRELRALHDLARHLHAAGPENARQVGKPSNTRGASS